LNHEGAKDAKVGWKISLRSLRLGVSIKGFKGFQGFFFLNHEGAKDAKGTKAM